MCKSSAFHEPTPISVEPSRSLNLLKRYFEILGDKSACYEDIQQYTDLDPEVSADWIAFLNGTTHTPVGISKCT